MKDKASKAGIKYEAKNIEFAKDTTAPTVTGTERVSATQVKVKFSEPVTISAGAVTADTTNVKVNGSAINAYTGTRVTEIVVDLSDASIAVGKEVKVTLNGVTDAVGNLITPQPTTVTVKKEAVDAVAPTITEVTQTGAKTFSIKFDKVAKLAAFTADKAEVEVSGSEVTAIEKVSDTEYKVTVAANLKGLQKVTVKSGKVTNLDGVATTADLTKTVTFSTDEVAPKATSKLVTKDGVEYIELTFDKDVNLVGSKEVKISGSYVNNYVTQTVSATEVVAKYADETEENKKVVLLPLNASGLNVKGAAYDVKIVNKDNDNGIKSVAGVAFEEATAKYTRGEDKPTAANTEVVKSVAFKAVSGNNDQIQVEFTFTTGFSLDGASATNPANYTVNGAEIESVTLGAASGTTQIVTLNLKKNSNLFTGTRNATVKDVKIAGSTKVMEAKTVITEVIKENVRPTLSTVAVTDGKEITLTFSEAIASTDANAFDVKIGGVLETGTQAKVESGKVVITLADALTNEELAKAITVEPSKTAANFVVKDAAGNLLEKFEAKTATIGQ